MPREPRMSRRLVVRFSGRKPVTVAEPVDRSSAGHSFLTWVGASTGIWTVAGAISFAVLWNAHRRFYEAFGLSPDEVELSRDRLLLRAALSGLGVFALLLAPLLLAAAGAKAVYDGARLDVVGAAALLTTVSCAIFFSSDVIAPDDRPLDLWALTLTLAVFASAFGVLLGMLLAHDAMVDDDWRRGLIGGVAVAGIVVAANLLTVHVLFGHVADGRTRPGLEVLGVIVLNVLLACVFARRGRPWLRSEGPEVERDPLAMVLSRKRSGILLTSLAVAVFALVWAVIRVSVWSTERYDEGKRAAELGYLYPNGWVTYWVRPVTIVLLEGNRDPVRVCQDSPGYAASLIARDGSGWWVLLRRLSDSGGYQVRTVWLPRTIYSVDLAPLAQLPREKPSADGANQGSGRLPEPWRLPAC
ncbi:hypothetical protein ACQP2X_02710 [Actinoplanes sp. CA-131856]